jgi:hypothetical protein
VLAHAEDEGQVMDRNISIEGTSGQFFFSYVRQSARGDQTDESSYLGDFPFPVVRSQISASKSCGEAASFPAR